MRCSICHSKTNYNRIWIEPNPETVPVLLFENLMLEKTQYWLEFCDDCFKKILKTLLSETFILNFEIERQNKFVPKRIRKKSMKSKAK